MLQEVIADRLALRGFTVELASDGREAVLAVQRRPPDVILMDMKLPVMSGWEAVAAIRALPADSAIPIIALTAHAATDGRYQNMAAACDDYEVKPINFDRLVRKIKRLVAHK